MLKIVRQFKFVDVIIFDMESKMAEVNAPKFARV